MDLAAHLNLLNSIVGKVQLLQVWALQVGERLQRGDAVIGQLQRLQSCVASQWRNLQTRTRAPNCWLSIGQMQIAVSGLTQKLRCTGEGTSHLCQLIVM